jgi:hypothetical protein
VRRSLAVLVLCLAQSAAGQEIDRSPRPPANPVYLAAPVVADAQPASAEIVVADGEAEPAALPAEVLDRSLRPVARPKRLAEGIAALKASSNAPGLDLSADRRGDEVDLAAIPPPTRKEERKKKREKASMKGAVCGIPAIKGEEIARITSKVEGCGIADPVAVTSVSGVRLSQTATVDCSAAKALNAWVDDVVQPAFGGKLVELQVAAHYICRSRNNVKGAKISEHGKGRAVDITAFTLANGKVLSVAQDYGRVMRRIHKAACSYFRTTLGPGSDGYHEDNLHYDTSARSGGAYCR